MARVFLTRQFLKFVRKNRIEDVILMAAIERADEGKVDANLGGCLVKLRIPRAGKGRSSGYRTVVAYRTGERAFYIYGFSKNERENISDLEEERFERYGALLLDLDDASLEAFVKDGNLEIGS